MLHGSQSANYDVVTIVASAGGIPPMIEVLSGLPADFPAAVLVVQHLSPVYPSRLAEVIAPRTLLPVEPAAAGRRIVPGTIYIAGAGRHLLISRQGEIELSESGKVSFVRPAGDLLFLSAAIRYGERAIGVVLSGRGQDGSMGVRALKGHGGVTIAQEPAGCEESAMPTSAIGTGCVDFVLPPESIAQALVALVMVRGAHTWFQRPAVLA